MAGVAVQTLHPDQLRLDEVRHSADHVEFSRDGKLIRVSAGADVAHLEFFSGAEGGALEFVAGISCDLEPLLSVAAGGTFQASEADRFLLVQPLGENVWLVFSAPELGYNESVLIGQSRWEAGLKLLRPTPAGLAP